MTSLAASVTDISATALRRGGHKAFRGVQEIARRVRGYESGRPETILMWPPVSTGTELTDLTTRLAWYLPDSIDVAIPMAGPVPAKPVSWFEPDDPENSPGLRLIDPDALPDSVDLVVVWKAGRRHYADPAILRRLERVMILDPNYLDTFEPSGYARLAADSMGPAQWNALDESSRSAFNRLEASSSGSAHALVYGTGPSMRNVTPDEVGADLVIACNSAVRDREWIRATAPDVITIADPAFHFAPNRYAKQFREDLIQAIADTNATLVTPRVYLPLIERHLPQLLENTIGLHPTTGGGPIQIPSPDRPMVTSTGNVLTLLMLPLAARLARHISIAGCDGRQKSETYFWKHDTTGQYDDELMQTVKDAHPAFFRDRSFTGYYRQHCDTVDAQIRALEARGTTVSCVTPSYVPALAERM